MRKTNWILECRKYASWNRNAIALLIYRKRVLTGYLPDGMRKSHGLVDLRYCTCEIGLLFVQSEWQIDAQITGALQVTGSLTTHCSRSIGSEVSSYSKQMPHICVRAEYVPNSQTNPDGRWGLFYRVPHFNCSPIEISILSLIKCISV